MSVTLARIGSGGVGLRNISWISILRTPAAGSEASWSNLTQDSCAHFRQLALPIAPK
ncbi:MAG: hypothetical protein WA988_06955 [Candidatus Nanopelagicales bacterium]